jgi:lipoprotein-anchoring transpeptidase ErfK/SrfK
MFMIISNGCTPGNKPNGSRQLHPANPKVNQNKGLMPLNNVTQVITLQKYLLNVSNNINQDRSIKYDAQKQQPLDKLILRQGDKGDKVKEIQQKLNKFNYKLEVDGDFGSATYNAVMDFQAKNKIPKDGIVGELTLKALDTAQPSDNMYKPQVIQNSIPNVTVSNNELEKFIDSKNFSSLTSYFIWIDLSHQKVNIFNGAYHDWHLVKSMVCSSGKASTPTIRGLFTVGNKGSYFISSGGAMCKDYTQISGNYLFHSILYDRSGSSIIDGTLGVPVSHGCVRLAFENAKFIYDNIQDGTAIWSN